MANEYRVTLLEAEALTDAAADARVTLLEAEALTDAAADARVTLLMAEALMEFTPGGGSPLATATVIPFMA